MSIELLIGYVAGASAIGSVFGLGLLCVLTVLLEKWRKRTVPDDVEDRLDDAERRMSELLRMLDELKIPEPAAPDAVEDASAPNKPGCVVCGTTRGRIKAKGKCKKCYERELGRERRAKARAKASPKRG